MFAFNPTAQTINPSGLKFAVKYSMKAGAVEITDDMLRNNYTIEVSLLRSHSSAVVSETTKTYCMCRKLARFLFTESKDLRGLIFADNQVVNFHIYSIHFSLYYQSY